jgi:serine/threonine protein kinase
MALPQDTQLVETLGEGSFAVVYVARLREGAMLRTVVLKVLKTAWADDEEIIGRARDEAAMLARLQHVNIIRVEQLTALQGHMAVVMEYVRGLTLDRVLGQAGPMPIEVALSITHKIADALDAAFNQVPPGMDGPLRVVHRDIKPSNVILGVQGDVKVLDFGTARAELMERQVETGSVTPGSPLYMAPERFDGLSRGAEVDIYSLGCTLYELITGEPLGRLSVHPSRHEKDVAEKVQALAPADLEEGIALAMLRSLIQRAVSYEPAHRPSAAEVRALCLSLAKRLPGSRMTRRQYCESVVSPIYRERERLPPVPLDGTLDPKAMAEAVEEVQRQIEIIDEGTDTPSLVAPSPQAADIDTGSSPPIRPDNRRPMALLVMMGLALALVALTFGVLLSRGGGSEPQAALPAPSVSAEALQPAEPEPVAAEPEAPVVEAVSVPLVHEPEPVAAEPEPEPAKAEPAPLVRQPVKAEPEPKAEPAPDPAPDPVPVEEAPTVAPVLVKVVSAPAGATVTIDGQRTGTPGELRLSPGTHKAKVSFSDGLSGRCTVTVAEGGRLVFRGTGGSVTCPSK